VIVSINQPAYLPWLGYVHRIATSDVHIVLDHVQFEKNSFVNRNKVRTSAGWCWLTVPVRTRGRFGDLAINRVQIDVGTGWRRKHWETLRQNYGRAPYFARHAPCFQDLLAVEWTGLADLCARATAHLLGAFGIGTPLVPSSALDVGGAKSELVLNLCRAVGATTYLSGPYGRHYLDEAAFRDAGIEIVYHDYRHPTYPQAYDPFEPAMAAVDLLFNCGPESMDILMRGQETAPRPAATALDRNVTSSTNRAGRSV